MGARQRRGALAKFVRGVGEAFKAEGTLARSGFARIGVDAEVAPPIAPIPLGFKAGRREASDTSRFSRPARIGGR